MVPLLSWKKSLWVGLLVCGANLALGQNYPNKPIRIVTGIAASGADFSARQVATGISSSLGQPVVVENRPGIVAYEIVSKAAPDGHTYGVGGSSLWISPLLRKTPYEMKDIAPVSMLSRTVHVVVVHPSVAAKSIKELIALAKARPGALNYSSAGVGGPQHLGAELLKSMAGIDIAHVPYSGTPQSVAALVGGEVQLTIADSSLVMPLVRAGRLRALAVTSATPSQLFPELPTVAASGFPGYEVETTATIFAPAKTPAPIINRVNQEIVRLFNRADVKEQYLNVGSEAATTTPAEFAAKIKSDTVLWGKVIKDAGIKGT